MRKTTIGLSCVCMFTLYVGAETLVSENLDDRNYGLPLLFYNVTGYNEGLVWNSTDALGGTGYCLQWDHTPSSAGIGILSSFATHAANGVYIRYWVKYASTYRFPGDDGLFENLKMFKLAGPEGYDIEFIYKDSAGGPKRLQLYWLTPASGVGGTGTGSVPIGKTLAKNEWHKIEIFIRLGSPSSVHVQIDDLNVYQNTNADIRLPASTYTGTNQFMSIRGSNKPSPGSGAWFTDSVTIVAGEGDRCNSEPPEPTANAGRPPSLTITSPTSAERYVSTTASVRLAGTAADDGSVSSVTWYNNRGQSGVAVNTGTNWSTWAIDNLALQSGDTVVTVRATDAGGLSSSDTLTLMYTPGDTMLLWDGTNQTGSSEWRDSSARWCVRLMVRGDALTRTSTGKIALVFKGRTSGSYSIGKVSVAECDEVAGGPDVVDSTWTRVTFDGRSTDTWATDQVTVQAGAEKRSDYLSFPLNLDTDYFVTFVLSSPSTYLVAPTEHLEYYFDGVDHADAVDWSGLPFSTYRARLHALSSIYMQTGTPGAPTGIGLVPR